MKHIYIEGYIYYITINVYKRLNLFVRPSFVILLYDSLNFYRYKQQFKLLGYVILPDHLHLLIWPYGKANVSDIMRDFKTFTSKRIIKQAEVENRQDLLEAFQKAGAKTGRSDNKVWQDNFWDKLVYSEKFLRQKLNYIHRNPVRAGLVDDVAAYPYSSYRNYEFDDNVLIEINKDWLF
ncbi:MAG: transposase [Chloroflexi bacterium]|nr:transposase [Chloroflexota bacterium]